jgi:hypothetical protein
MAKILCPLQHQSLVRTLVADDKESDDDDQMVDVALQRVSDCIAQRTLDHDQARKK